MWMVEWDRCEGCAYIGVAMRPRFHLWPSAAYQFDQLNCPHPGG
jgi:hypothetical protein